MVPGCIVCSPVVRQHVKVENCGREKLSAHVSQKAVRNQGKDPGQGISFKDTPSDLRPPAMPHHLKLTPPPKIVSSARDQIFKT
jgi:hypothetical protein